LEGCLRRIEDLLEKHPETSLRGVGEEFEDDLESRSKSLEGMFEEDLDMCLRDI
jgi:hypothetical protein